ncbi:MAG: hypothetical protein H0T46_01735 [Deltaproteobacteria bacterium]|nr:hypothetical protein [Deltaproteobacteria bacterium]
MSPRRLAFVLAIATSAVLVAMVMVSVVTGATQEAHEYYSPPRAYAVGLLAHANGLRLLMGLDLAFLVLYTALFATLAKFLTELGRPFVRLALAFMIGTAVLDAIEDHQIITALDLAQHGELVSETWVAAQQVLSGTKFALSYVGLVLFGLAIPRTRKLGIVLAVFLTVGTLLTAVLSLGAPPDLRANLDSTRWLSFLAGFTVLALWLRTEPDPS